MILAIVTTPDTRYVYLNCRFRKAVRDMCIVVSGMRMYSYLKTVGSFFICLFCDWSSKVFENSHFEDRKIEGNNSIM
jgi:hypothetical protein